VELRFTGEEYPREFGRMADEASKKLGSHQVHRRTWDVDEYQKKADEKASQREEEVNSACLFWLFLAAIVAFSLTKISECKCHKKLSSL
jgi:hypothetical protein